MRLLGRSVVWSVAAVSTVVAAGLTLGASSSPEATSFSTRSSENSTEAGEVDIAVYPLDDIPGLGISPDAALRDEVISYWEAWRRDSLTHECMLDAGFQWLPEVSYPEQVVLELAGSLNAPKYDGSQVGAAPEVKNAALQDVLTGNRNEYFQALYGEPANVIDHVQRTGGELPEGETADGFANGGCWGASARSVGSLWDLDRSLAESLDQLRSDARATAAFAAGQQEYSDCAKSQGLGGIDHPEDLEALALTSGTTLSLVEAVDSNCRQIWDEANARGMVQASIPFRAAHAAALEEQQVKYAGLPERISVDRGFLEFLGVTAARIRFEGQ